MRATLTIAEASRRLGISAPTLRGMLAAGELTSVAVGTQRRLSAHELERKFGPLPEPVALDIEALAHVVRRVVREELSKVFRLFPEGPVSTPCEEEPEITVPPDFLRRSAALHLALARRRTRP